MIAIYDMTSGTLRKELEAQSPVKEKHASVEIQAPALHAPEPRLQEIEFTGTAEIHTLPEHLAAIKVEDFIDTMK